MGDDNPYYTSGKHGDAAWRRERARKAARARNSLDAHVEAIATRAESLTPEHAAKLRALLPPPARELTLTAEQVAHLRALLPLLEGGHNDAA